MHFANWYIVTYNQIIKENRKQINIYTNMTGGQSI